MLLDQQRNANTVGDYNARVAQAKMNDPNSIGFAMKADQAKDQQAVLDYNTASTLNPFVLGAKKEALTMDKNSAVDTQNLREVGRVLEDGGLTDAKTGVFQPFSKEDIQILKQDQSNLLSRMAATPQLSGELQKIQTTMDGRAELESMKGAYTLQRSQAEQDFKSRNGQEAAIYAKQAGDEIKFLSQELGKLNRDELSNEMTNKLFGLSEQDKSKVLDGYKKSIQEQINEARARQEHYGKQMGVDMYKPTEQPTPTPTVPTKQMESTDIEAANFVKANPTHPKAAAITAKLNAKYGAQ